MTTSEIVQPNQIVLLDEGLDKQRLLRDLGDRAGAALGIEARQLTAALFRREDLGSTGLGGGVAIPHTRIPGISRSFSLLAILRTPIEFEAIDDRPVDVVFLLVATDSADALKSLAGISRILREPALVERLRHAESAQAAFDALDAWGQ